MDSRRHSSSVDGKSWHVGHQSLGFLHSNQVNAIGLVLADSRVGPPTPMRDLRSARWSNVSSVAWPARGEVNTSRRADRPPHGGIFIRLSRALPWAIQPVSFVLRAALFDLGNVSWTDLAAPAQEFAPRAHHASIQSEYALGSRSVRAVNSATVASPSPNRGAREARRPTTAVWAAGSNVPGEPAPCRHPGG